MIQIKAKQQNVSFEKNVEKLAFVLSAHLYNTLSADKVIEEAAKQPPIAPPCEGGEHESRNPVGVT